jgi:class 3 adenylate cyclase
MEHYGDDVVGHAARILPHLRRAPAEAPFTTWSLELTRPAAEQAAGLGAWGVAANYYEDELLVTADPAERIRLHLLVAQAFQHNHDLAAAHPHLLTAIDLATSAGDHRAWGEALFWLTAMEVTEQRVEHPFDKDLVERFLATAGDEASDERALVLANLAQFHFGRFEIPAGRIAIRQARALTEQTRRLWVRHFVVAVEGLNHLGALELDRAHACFAEAMELTPDPGDPWRAVWLEACRPLIQLVSGELGAAEKAAAAAEVSSLATNQWNLHGLALACRAAAAMGQGRVIDAAAWASAAIESYRRSDYFYAAAVGFPALAGALAYVGDIDGGRAALAEWRAVVGGLTVRYEVMLEALAGEPERARRLLEEAPLMPLPAQANLFTVGQAVAAVEVGDRLNDLDLVKGGYDHLVDAYGRGVRACLDWTASVPRLLAQAALRLGDDAACDRWLGVAEGANGKDGSALERALRRVIRGRLLVRAGQEDKGERDLQLALAYFEAARLLPFAAELRRSDVVSSLRRRRDIAVGFVSLDRSAALLEVAGDQLYRQLQREFHSTVQQRLLATGGTRFHDSDDALGAWFESVERALEFGFRLHDDLIRLTRAHPQLPLVAKTSIARGDVDDGLTLSGRTVMRAIRLLEFADAGQIVVSEEARAATGPGVAEFTHLGSHRLDGFAAPEVLYGAGPPDAALR